MVVGMPPPLGQMFWLFLANYNEMTVGWVSPPHNTSTAFKPPPYAISGDAPGPKRVHNGIARKFSWLW